MPKQINNADAAQALTRAYSLKGRVNLQLDEMVVPVTVVDDLSEEGTPIELRPCGVDITQANVSGEFGYIGVQTQAGFALVCEFFDAINEGTTETKVLLVILSAANLATVGISAGSLLAKDLPKDVTVVGSQFIFGTAATEVGSVLGTYLLAPESTTRIPVGVTIYGIDNPNRRAVALRRTPANLTIQAAVTCVERNEE